MGGPSSVRPVSLYPRGQHARPMLDFSSPRRCHYVGRASEVSANSPCFATDDCLGFSFGKLVGSHGCRPCGEMCGLYGAQTSRGIPLTDDRSVLAERTCHGRRHVRGGGGVISCVRSASGNERLAVVGPRRPEGLPSGGALATTSRLSCKDVLPG